MVSLRLVILLLTSFVISASAGWVNSLHRPHGREYSVFNKEGRGRPRVVDLVDDGQEMLRAQRLAGAIKIPTVSNVIPSDNEEQHLKELHQYIIDKFPLIHSSPFISREVTIKNSLLYTVTGKQRGTVPFMLCSHLDVVPANNPQDWDVLPFSGQIVNKTFVYGRGTIDDKGGVFGILEAVEFMLKKSGQPVRTFFMAFGHDEEVTGSGAVSIADLLKSKGIHHLDFISDEGHPITHNVFPGVDKNVAMIGIAEKGSLTVNLTVRGTPGHSSMPPAESAIGILAAAVSRLEQNKLPTMLGQGPERYTLEGLAPYASPEYQELYANIDEHNEYITSIMEKSPLGNAVIRTTTALTIFKSGDANNVVPAIATAVVNHRIHPSQTVDEILEFDRSIINDPRVNIEIISSREPSPESPFENDAHGYQVIKKSIEQAFPDTVVVPGSTVGNTDTTFYLDLSDQIYRFFPNLAEPIDLTRYHGNNERISIQNYQRAVNFYYRVIRNAEMAATSSYY